MGQCLSSEENLRAPEAAFSLLPYVWSLPDEDTERGLFLLLNRFFIFFTPHVFPGWKSLWNSADQKDRPHKKWQRVGNPRLLTCLFFLHQLCPEIVTTTKTNFLSSKLKLSWIKNHYFTWQSFTQINKKIFYRFIFFSIKNCYMNGDFHHNCNFQL